MYMYDDSCCDILVLRFSCQTHELKILHIISIQSCLQFGTYYTNDFGQKNKF